MKEKMKANSKKFIWVGGVFVGFLFIVLVTIMYQSNRGSVSLTHIHGLGFTSDGKQLIIPAHDGLMSYSEDRWQPMAGKKHDYMGFNLVDNGFYSSGHPAPGSELENPLGIIKSIDNGKTLELLDFQGVEDFHGMAVGYKTHTIYAINSQPNLKMNEVGLYISQDETKTWNMSGLDGLTGDMTSIAAHPTETNTVAIGTSSGIFVSNNFGEQFVRLSVEQEVTAVAYGISGDLFIGGRTVLLRQTGKEIIPLVTPFLDSDEMITYITQNPKNENELAFSTSTMNIYFSRDRGISWTKIVEVGKGL
ncbi:MAG: F510_1955 family glycosylhydrolase [Candidatus Pristimantibacillus sp.]